MASLMVLASSGGGALVGLIILAIPYFAPSIVAFVRHHHNRWAIFALNLLLGGGRASGGSAHWRGRSPGRRLNQPSCTSTHDETRPPAEPPAEGIAHGHAASPARPQPRLEPKRRDPAPAAGLASNVRRLTHGQRPSTQTPLRPRPSLWSIGNCYVRDLPESPNQRKRWTDIMKRKLILTTPMTTLGRGRPFCSAPTVRKMATMTANSTASTASCLTKPPTRPNSDSATQSRGPASARPSRSSSQAK